ncbi:MAG: hypothetical protein ABEK12_01105, partial [Candidatus Nanohaloarchaea archaeon]
MHGRERVEAPETLEDVHGSPIQLSLDACECEPWQEHEGSVEKPRYNLNGGLADSVQTTLDPYRAIQEFEEYVTEVDDHLRGHNGFGVVAAFMQGSAVTGTTLHPDAAYNAGRHPEDASDSDIDLVLIVDDREDDNHLDTAAHVAWRRNSKWPFMDDERYPSLPVNPMVYTRERFIEELDGPL